MERQEGPKPLLSGVVYGQCAFVIALIGFAVSVGAIVWYFFAGRQFFDADRLMQDLWSGKDVAYIWRHAADSNILPGHWYLQKLAFADGISMLGIGIICLAGVVGSWAAWLTMLIRREKPRIFLIFAFIISLLLTASATGLIVLA